MNPYIHKPLCALWLLIATAELVLAWRVRSGLIFRLYCYLMAAKSWWLIGCAFALWPEGYWYGYWWPQRVMHLLGVVWVVNYAVRQVPSLRVPRWLAGDDNWPATVAIVVAVIVSVRVAADASILTYADWLTYMFDHVLTLAVAVLCWVVWVVGGKYEQATRRTPYCSAVPVASVNGIPSYTRRVQDYSRSVFSRIAYAVTNWQRRAKKNGKSSGISEISKSTLIGYLAFYTGSSLTCFMGQPRPLLWCVEMGVQGAAVGVWLSATRKAEA